MTLQQGGAYSIWSFPFLRLMLGQAGRLAGGRSAPALMEPFIPRAFQVLIVVLERSVYLKIETTLEGMPFSVTEGGSECCPHLLETADMEDVKATVLEDAAARRIQASFRGFSVRRCQPLRKLRLIADVRSKLKKLEMRASDPVYVDKLCTHPMENRKMKEEIMALLLELDSIQGVLHAVRRIRKSVTRDVVQFQEIVDAVKVDAVVRNDAEEVTTRASEQQVNLRPSEQANRRSSAPAYPALRRVMSLDDNVYPEQSYVNQGNKKKIPDGAAGDSSNRSSDEDATPRRRSEGWVKNPLLLRSMSGNHRSLTNKGPSLVRTFSELPVNGVWNPLTGRSVSEVVRKPTNKSPLLGRNISEVQRKKNTAASSVPPTSLSDDRGSPVVTNSAPARQKEISFSREEAAIFIQSTFRGHLSRRSRPLHHLRTISVVTSRLSELNRQLADPVCVGRLRTDEMERLKWSEEITALLLKLDSIQGVVQAIRDIRKSVTREVIKLQEAVDSIIHEADILSRLGAIEGDASIPSTERLGFGPELSDQESLDKDRGEQGYESGPSKGNVGMGDSRAQQDSPLWDDKYVDLREPRASGHCFEGSTASSPGEKAGENTEGMQQPFSVSGAVVCQHPSPARIQKKPKRLEREKVPNGILTDSVSADLETSVAPCFPHQLEMHTNGYAEKPVEAVRSMRSSDEFAPSDRQLHGNSDDVLMVAGEELNSQSVYAGCENGKSLPRSLISGHYRPEERACEFLRSRCGHCEEFISGITTTSEESVVHRSAEDQWTGDRLTALEDENARLKLYLSEVLTFAENQVEDLQNLKKRIAELEKDRVQYTKKDDTVLRKKPAYPRRRR
ncbi:hypothetical protein R1flu_000410 [Riccia fluitans]|uniref:BAG domain-containing protein n=1 Tax=Riccia fluitans TaxID=41844 RepID=A0ABD1Y0D4_9MARC